MFGAAFSVSLANLTYIVFGHVPVPVLQSYILEPLALLPAIFLTHANHRQTQTSSSTLLLFWPVYTVALLVWGRALVATHSENISGVIVPLALRSAVAVFGLFSFALELFAPKFEADLGEEIDETYVDNPITSANILSRWSFSYVTPLLKNGSKEYITDKDLPSLLKQDQATELDQKLAAALAKRYFPLFHRSPLSLTHHHRKSLYLGLAFTRPFALALFLKVTQDCL